MGKGMGKGKKMNYARCLLVKLASQPGHNGRGDLNGPIDLSLRRIAAQREADRRFGNLWGEPHAGEDAGRL